MYRDNNGTENDHPEIFNEEQLFIVLELGNGGQDLEAFTFENALQSHSAFLQVSKLSHILSFFITFNFSVDYLLIVFVVRFVCVDGSVNVFSVYYLFYYKLLFWLTW